MLESLALLILMLVWPQGALAWLFLVTGHPFLALLAFCVTFVTREVVTVEKIVERRIYGGPKLSRADAYAVLGCAPEASRQALQAAYKNMMIRVHPDRGGSGWLATKVNEAREVLLR